ncbi:hypothetical protein EWM64_g661 [Hericium alpestre]|uniref:PEHE domain-containing protein n=1 Tax=Hericium alpestre TaxID=135208 RepID=A0A4Z0A9X9_9AGAM|nr:hypothetical protein EWM64_g661 [Hericium alpestre]
MITSSTFVSTVQERVSSKGSIPATPVAGPSTPTPAQTPTTSAQTRQKRILPSRSRRGGPGVGSCDADVMILDMLKRKHGDEPLIPADTRLLLTTKSELAPSSSLGTSFEFQLNTSAYDRYFDKPEVLKAYKEQLVIQTPEFTTLPEHATVGGRFRPRGHVEEESADTSDAAYEKRHRKYETFEKRQRLREKEKLKHEHYKLKERIDQLRAMHASGFLTIPDLAPESTADEKPVSISSDSTAREAERRKELMLECAQTLEARYRTLLNPDHGRTIEKNGRQESEAMSVGPAGLSLKARGKGIQEEEESEEDEEEVDQLDEESEPEVKPAPPQEKLKLRIRWPAGMGRNAASARPSQLRRRI